MPSKWRERKYTIVTEESLDAPSSHRWAACYNGFDLDIETGIGATEEEAIIELISLYDLPGVEAMNIVIHYYAIDGCHDKKVFHSLQKARDYAFKWVGAHAEFGHGYAISDDGIGKIVIEGCTLKELFGRSE